MLRIMAKHADIISPMTTPLLPIEEARAKINTLARDNGRNPDALRWTGGGTLFMHDDPAVVQRVLASAVDAYNQPEDEIRRSGLCGSPDDVRESIRRQLAEGATDIIVFQLPRVHMKSLMRFSDDIIPEFV